MPDTSPDGLRVGSLANAFIPPLAGGCSDASPDRLLVASLGGSLVGALLPCACSPDGVPAGALVVSYSSARSSCLTRTLLPPVPTCAALNRTSDDSSGDGCAVSGALTAAPARPPCRQRVRPSGALCGGARLCVDSLSGIWLGFGCRVEY